MNETLVIGSLIGVFVVVCILFEAFIIWRFKITRFAPALLHAALVSLTSAAVIYFIWPLMSRMNIDEDKVFPLLPILVSSTILVEGLVLKLVNYKQPLSRIFLTTSVMNIASFTILYLLLLLL